MTGIELYMQKPVEKTDLPINMNELRDFEELSKVEESSESKMVDPPDILFIERTSRAALMEQCWPKVPEVVDADETTIVDTIEANSEVLIKEEKIKIKEETDWSDEIIDNIQNMKQYEILKDAKLVEVEIDSRKCLIKENIDLDYTDEDGVSNRDRIIRGLAPLASETGQPIELHHLGQKANSPLIELTVEEHRTGEYENGKKNQSLWHDNTKETEVHGEGNSWKQEKEAHWKARVESGKG